MFGHPPRPARRRYELLTHLECLKLRHLRLHEITVAGVALGSAAADLPLAQVRGVCRAPGDVAEDGWRSAAPCHEVGAASASFGEVMARAIATDGLLILHEHVGLRLRDGVVHGIELHAPALRHFGYIRSYVELLHQFGLPEAVATHHIDGEPATHTLLYREPRKTLVWECASRTLGLARLDDDDERPRRRPPSRGIRPDRAPRLAPAPVAPAWGWARYAT